MSPRSNRVHRSLYGRLVAITPPSHRRRFGQQQVTLFGDLLESGEHPLRLWLRALPDLFRVFTEYKEEMVSHSARLALWAISMAPLALAVVLAGVAIDEFGDVPAWLALVAFALALQGGFTMLWLSGRLGRWRRLATDGFIVGEVAALLAGGLVVALTVSSQDPSDPAYGPITVGVVAATHALIGLVALLTSGRTVPTA